MSERDGDDELASRLFAAARSEQAPAAVRASVASAVRRDVRRRPATLPRLALVLAAAAVCVLAVLAALSRRSSQPETSIVAAPDAIPMRTLPSTLARPSATRAVQAQPRSSEAATARPERAPTKAPTFSLAQEISALDAVRAALERGDAADALARLHRYEHTRGAERLRTEAMVLRVEALTAAGQSTAAATLARRFLQTYPSSPLADRVRTLAAPEEPLHPPGDAP